MVVVVVVVVKRASFFTREELRDIFTLREDTLCDTHDLVRCECGSDGGQNTAASCHPTDQAHVRKLYILSNKKVLIFTLCKDFTPGKITLVIIM